MMKITKHTDEKSMHELIKKDQLVEFLYTHLDRFRDDKSAISKAIDYAFSSEAGKGGFILLAHSEANITGALVMNKTGMDEFIPAHILVYIAVDANMRGKGIGKLLIETAFDSCEGGIALHVEYDNPAKKLYERLGFRSKYAEMRWTGK